MDSARSSPIRWCEGLRSIGLRKLSPNEVEELRLVVRAAPLRFWLPIAIAIASPLTLYVSFLLHENGPEPPLHRLVPICILMLLGGIILPAASLLVSRDIVNRWRLLRRDLEESTVEQFTAVETCGNDDVSYDSSEAPRKLEILPNSGIVFSIDGSSPAHRTTVHVYESSSPPESMPYEMINRILTRIVKILFRRRRPSIKTDGPNALLNYALELARECGEDWPIQERLGKAYPHFTQQELDHYNAIAQEAMKYGYDLVYTMAEKNGKNISKSDWNEAYLSRYPWVDKKNLSRLFSAGKIDAMH
jgi:hypothetical protein